MGCVDIRSLSLIRYLSSKCRASFLKRTQQNRMTRGINTLPHVNKVKAINRIITFCARHQWELY